MCIARITLLIVSIWIISEFSCSSGLSGPPANRRCPPLSAIRHGKIQYMNKRRFARFQCVKGYLIAGDKVAICADGQWEGKVPKCVKPGCSKIESPENGLSYASPDLLGSVVTFFCLFGYDLIGASMTFCNGTHWDNPLPVCRESGSLPQTSCDFETGLCGWNPDLNHDFDWTRHSRRTPSRVVGTGPSYDHTKGPEEEGYYMYIESSSKLVNDTARLLSPIFGRPVGCMELYYHMYGHSIGTLNVYVLPLGLFQQYSLTRLPPPSFTRTGNQGDNWLHAVIPLNDTVAPFQIIIEGIRGQSYMSDIAIDDFQLLDSCPVEETETPEDDITFTEATTLSDNDPINSCADRCNGSVPTPGACLCSDSCIIDRENCCADFIFVCIFDQFTGDSTDTYGTEPVSEDYIPTDWMTDSVTPIPTSRTTVRHTVRPTLRPTVRPTVRTTVRPTIKSTVKPTIRTTVGTTVRTTIRTTVRPMVTFTKAPPLSTTTTTQKRSETVKKTSTGINVIATTSRYVASKNSTRPVTKPDYAKKNKNRIKTTTQPDIKAKNDIPNVPYTPSTNRPNAVVVPSTKATPGNDQSNDVADVPTPIPDNVAPDAPTSASRTYAFYTKRVPMMAPVESTRAEVDEKSRAVVWVVVGALIALVALISTLAMRRYGCASGINISKLKKHKCSTDSVSDVRFLTSDEILDFTLAQPADETDSLL